MLIITFLQRLCPDPKYLTCHTCCLNTDVQTYKKALVLRFANQLNLLHLQNVSGGVKMIICSAGLSWSVTLLSFYFSPQEIVSLFLGFTRFISSFPVSRLSLRVEQIPTWIIFLARREHFKIFYCICHLFTRFKENKKWLKIFRSSSCYQPHPSLLYQNI